ncbi:zonular occludens toxin domain-containing protein [uncultured Pseudacidovorax sp.]|uniref:zonular occludens toxin family protein n=1 Tax=uncultured Pseudacidovorax sp. TaxID=679313 RepID=UPI0025D6F1B0|nr:zonular occludens toxin domain-containing protein [uncultured Pseudacidovorax sp.]
MAILFFEGLPGAGKSYEAMATQIIPALQKGRPVVAYIEGLNHARIAEAAGLPLERVGELLQVLTRDDMRPREVKQGSRTVQVDGAWIERTKDNALHVFDEAQTWWPNRLRPTEALTQFVTEHRHRGIDVLLMGQSLLDLLALWRRRVDQRFTFLKLTALGSTKRYRVTIAKGQGNDEFVKVKDSISKYDPKYFGTYASHVSDDTNTETYTDSRAVFWKSGMVRYGAVFAVAALVWGGWKAWSFFHPVAPPASPGASVNAPQTLQPAAYAPPATAPAPGQPSKPKTPQEAYFSDLSAKYRVRLAGLMRTKDRTAGVLEWLDGNTRVVERMSLDQARDLGVSVTVIGEGAVRLASGEWLALATTWPVEAVVAVSEARQQSMRPKEPAGPANGSGLMVIGGGKLDGADKSQGADLKTQPTAVQDRKTWTPGQSS